MKNILIFSPIFTHPIVGGNIARIHNIALELKKQGHKIHFVYYELFTYEMYGITQGYTHIEAMKNTWDSITIIPSNKSPFNAPQNGTYFEIDEWLNDNVIHQFDEQFKNKIDIVICNYIFTSKVLEYFPNALKILDTHDKLADRHIEQQKLGIKPDFFYTTQEEEKKACERSDVIIAIQDDEKKYFQNLCPDKKVITISHIEDEKFLNKSYGELKDIGFLGSFSSMNIESLKDFLYISGGLEFLQKNNINLHLAGGICNYFKEDIPNIIKHGYVEDVREFYNSMDCMIAPMTNGAGINIKTIEALSYGVPILGTKLGFRGTEATHGLTYFKHNKRLIEVLKNIKKYQCEGCNLLNMDRNESQKLFKKYITKNKNNLRKLVK